MGRSVNLEFDSKFYHRSVSCFKAIGPFSTSRATVHIYGFLFLLFINLYTSHLTNKMILKGLTKQTNKKRGVEDRETGLEEKEEELIPRQQPDRRGQSLRQECNVRKHLRQAPCWFT